MGTVAHVSGGSFHSGGVYAPNYINRLIYSVYSALSIIPHFQYNVTR